MSPLVLLAAVSSFFSGCLPLEKIDGNKLIRCYDSSAPICFRVRTAVRRQPGLSSPPFSGPDELAHFYRAYHCSQGKLYACRHGQTGDELPSSLADTYVAIVDQTGNESHFGISWAKIKKPAAFRLIPAARFAAFSKRPCIARFPIYRKPWRSGLLVFGSRPRLPCSTWRGREPDRLPALNRYRHLPRADPQVDDGHGGPDTDFRLPCGLAFGRRHNNRPVDTDRRPDPEPRFGRRSAGPPRFACAGIAARASGSLETAYLGLVLLFLLIPGKKFSSPGRRWWIAALLIGLPLAIDAAWMYSLRGLYIPMLSFVNPQAQLHWILSIRRTIRADVRGDLSVGTTTRS